MNRKKSEKVNQKNSKLRLSWFKYSKKSKNIAKTCRYFGISRQTYYKWLKRYIKYGRRGLINQSKRPKSIKFKIDQKLKRYIKNLMKNGLKPFEIKNRVKKIKKLEISYSYLQKLRTKTNKK